MAFKNDKKLYWRTRIQRDVQVRFLRYIAAKNDTRQYFVIISKALSDWLADKGF